MNDIFEPPSPSHADPPAADDRGGNDQAKVFAILGYIIPFLFFLPLLTHMKSSPVSRFHANQQLNLLLYWVIGMVVTGVLKFVLIGFFLQPIVFLVGVILSILGIVNAATGQQKQLPFIGKWSLIS